MSTKDISVERLLNEGGIGEGSNKKAGFVPIDTAGQADHRTAITVDNTAQEITPTIDKRTIELQVTGDKIVYYGGAGVTSVNGIKLYPNNTKVFANIKDTFSIYLVTEGAETSKVRIVEYS